jgi:hypothetical protein
MNATTITVKVMAHLWAVEIGGDSGAGDVIVQPLARRAERGSG